MKKFFLGIIPARKGSKGVKNKNLQKIGKETLVKIAAIESKKSKFLNEIVCTSDSKKILDEAKLAGILTIKRPKRLASDKSSTWDAVKHVLNVMKMKKKIIDYVVILQPTTPFRTHKQIDQAIKEMLKQKKDSCISVKKSAYPPEWMFWEKKNTNVTAKKTGLTNRQQTKVALHPNGYIFIMKSSMIYKNPFLPQSKTLIYQMNNIFSVNIDNYQDLELARVLDKNKKYLNKIKIKN